MSIEQIILKCQKQGIRLFLDEGKLCYDAPAGVMNAEIREELSNAKGDLIRFLSENESPVITDRENLNVEFNLTNIQLAYTVGKGDLYDFGQTDCKIYCEIKYPIIDIGKFKESWADVVKTNEMLHAVIFKNGKQKIMEEYDVPDIEFMERGLNYSFNDSHLESVRRRLSSKTYELDKWPLYDLEVTSFNDCSIVHLSLDMLIADFTSIGVIVRDFEAVYFENRKLTDKGISFRDIIIFNENEKKTSRYKIDYNKSKKYWLEKIDNFPESPILSTINKDDGVIIKQFNLRITKQQELEIQNICSQNKITLTSFILAAYAEVLSRWSSKKRFCINVTFSERDNIHPNINAIVGDFTDVNLLEINNLSKRNFIKNAQNIQLQLWKDIDNRKFSGIDVIREISRLKKQNVIYPYVFTSALGIQENIKNDSVSDYGELVYKITQTPQVLLDCQVMRDKGGILVTWDVRKNVFPEGMIESAFKSFSDIIASKYRKNVDEKKENLILFDEENILPTKLYKNNKDASFMQKIYIDEVHSNMLIEDSLCKYSYKDFEIVIKNIQGLLIKNRFELNDTVIIDLNDIFLEMGAIIAVLSVGGIALPRSEIGDFNELDLLKQKYNIKYRLSGGTNDNDKENELFKNIKNILIEPNIEETREKILFIEKEEFLKGSLITKEIDYLGQVKHRLMYNKNIICLSEKYIDMLEVKQGDKLLICEDVGKRVILTYLLMCLSSGATLKLEKKFLENKDSTKKENLTLIHITSQQLEMLRQNPILRSKLKSYMFKTIVFSVRASSMCLDNQYLKMLNCSKVIHILDDFATEEDEHYLALYNEHKETDSNNSVFAFDKNLSSGDIMIFDESLSMCPKWVVGDIYIKKNTTNALCYDSCDIDDKKGNLIKTKFRGMFDSVNGVVITSDSRADININNKTFNVFEIEKKINSLKNVHNSAVVFSENDSEIDIYVEPNLSKTTHPTSKFDSCSVNVEDNVLNLNKFSEWIQASNDTAIEDMLSTFFALDVFVNKNQWYSIQEIYRKTKVVDNYKKLLKRWVNVLVTEKIIEYDSNKGYKILEQTVINGRAWERWKEADVTIKYSDIMMNYFYESRMNLIKLLQGKINPVELFFPNGSFDVALAAYKNNPVSKVMNEATIKYIDSIIDGLEKKSSNRIIKILEVGAGVGGTTIDLMQKIQKLNVEYLFTDISYSFINEAEKNFAEYKNMKFDIYDINKEYFEQGLDCSEFDLIICNNTFHNAKDEVKTLEQFKWMLAEDGYLIILEGLPGNYALLTSMEFHAGLEQIEGFRAKNEEVFLSREDMSNIVEMSDGDLVAYFPNDDRESTILGQSLYIVKFRKTLVKLDENAILGDIRKILSASTEIKTLNVVNSIPYNREGVIYRKKLKDSLIKRTKRRTKANESSNCGIRAATRVERDVVKIWKEVLKVDNLNTNDNFFEIGGDSLIAAQIASKMKQQLKEFEDIPWDKLMLELIQSNSLSEMCNKLVNASKNIADKDNIIKAKLITLNKNHNATSACVLFHDGLGSLSPYSSLIPLISKSCPCNLYGFGDVDKTSFLLIPPDKVISTLGYEYANCLEQTGEREFNLIGFCTGGLIAIETGKILLEKGFTVNLITTIDTMICKKMILNTLLLERAFGQLIGADIYKAGHTVSNEELKNTILYLSQNYNPDLIKDNSSFLESVSIFENVKSCYMKLNGLEESERFELLLDSVKTDNFFQKNSISDIKSSFEIFSHSFEASILYDPGNYVGNVKILFCDNNDFTFLPIENIENEKFWSNAILGDIGFKKIDGNHLTCLSGIMAVEVFEEIFSEISYEE